MSRTSSLYVCASNATRGLIFPHSYRRQGCARLLYGEPYHQAGKWLFLARGLPIPRGLSGSGERSLVQPASMDAQVHSGGSAIRKFYFDRSIGEYCEQIWNVKPVHVEVGR